MLTRRNGIEMAVVVAAGLLLGGCPERSPEGVTQQPPRPIECAFDAPKAAGRPVLAVTIGPDLKLIRGDLTQVPVLGFAEGRTFTWISTALQQRGDYVLATALFDDPVAFVQLFEVALVTTDGDVLWRLPPETRFDQAFLGDGGVVALGKFHNDGAVRFPDGEEGALPGLLPFAPPAADGTVAARTASWGSPLYGWARPGQEAMDVLAYTPSGQPLPYGTGVVYTAYGTDAMAVVETPDDVRTIALPVLPTDGSAWLASVRPEGFAVAQCGGYEQPAILRIDLTRGTAERMDLTFPDGLRRFNSAQWDQPRLDDEGNLLLGLRDDVEGGLYRSEDGAEWERVGAPVTNVLAVDGDGRAGTYLEVATNAVYSSEEWGEPPPDAIDGESLHAVRPELEVTARLPSSYDMWIARQPGAPSPLISPDGACVAYWSLPAKDYPHLNVLAVATGNRFPIGGGAPLDAYAFAWLP